MSSILYKTLPGKTLTLDNAVADDLMADAFIEFVTADPELRKSIRALLLSPPASAEDISYRREIIDDFYRNPSLYGFFSDLLKDADTVENNIRLALLGNPGVLTAAGTGLTADSGLAVLKMRAVADALVRAVRMYREAYARLKDMKLFSGYFDSLSRRVARIVSNPDLDILEEAAVQITSSVTLDTSFTLRLTLNRFFCLENSDIFQISTDPYNYTEKEREKKRKTGDNIYADRKFENLKEKYLRIPYDRSAVKYIDFDSETESRLRFCTERAVSRFSSLLESIVRSLTEPLRGISEEMFFYRFAFLEEKKLRELGIRVTLPVINGQSGYFELKDLRDPVLCVNAAAAGEKPQERVTANSLLSPGTENAVIISGKNNGGKTVFLRSVGLACLLGRSGLFITAERAEMCAGGIYTVFAGKDTGKGRFEDEVIAAASVFERAGAGDTVFFNELFQSTAYQEGAEAFAALVAALAAKGVKTVAVSHLPELKRLLPGVYGRRNVSGGCLFLRASEEGESYKMLPDSQ